jgi:hypothetical protein
MQLPPLIGPAVGRSMEVDWAVRFFDLKVLAGGFIIQAATRRMASSTSAPESVF